MARAQVVVETGAGEVDRPVGHLVPFLQCVQRLPQPQPPGTLLIPACAVEGPGDGGGTDAEEVPIPFAAGPESFGDLLHGEHAPAALGECSDEPVFLRPLLGVETGGRLRVRLVRVAVGQGPAFLGPVVRPGVRVVRTPGLGERVRAAGADAQQSGGDVAANRLLLDLTHQFAVANLLRP